MKFAKTLLIMIFSLSLILSSVSSFALGIKNWNDVVKSSSPVKIYIENIVNKTDDKNVDIEKVGEAVKSVFSERLNPKFQIVTSAGDADIIFKGVVSDYVWSKKAPITNVYSAGGLVMDEMTRGKKQWARMELDYKITSAKEGTLLLDYETQVTLKKAGIPEDKSYGMINERLPKVLSMDVFKRYKRSNKL